MRFLESEDTMTRILYPIAAILGALWVAVFPIARNSLRPRL